MQLAFLWSRVWSASNKFPSAPQPARGAVEFRYAFLVQQDGMSCMPEAITLVKVVYRRDNR